MTEKAEPQKVPKKSHKKMIAIIAGVVVAVVVIIAALSIINNQTNTPSNSPSPTPPPAPTTTSHTDTMYTSGAVESLTPSMYYYSNFTLPSNAANISLTGSYTSNNNIEVGVLSSTQFGAFTQNQATITSADWYSGNNQGTTINFAPTAGHSYTLVLYDANLLTSDTFTVVNAIVLTYTTTS